MAKIEINRRPYWIYANYIDYQNKSNYGRHIKIMAKIELPDYHIGFIVIYKYIKPDMTAIIEFMLIIEMAKIEFNWRPYWNLMLGYIDYQA